MGRVSRFSVAARAPFTALLVTSLVTLGGAVLAPAASAEDESVVRRLTKHGQLRRGESESLSDSVSKRMRRAADMTNPNDPLRMAVSRALYNVPVPKDAMAAAKVRLRLYAGLNEWALENLFAPRPGGLAQCQQEFAVSGRQCEALIAASGRIPAAEASRLASGQSTVAMAPMPAQPAAVNHPVAAQPTTSRFGRYDSGFRGAAPAPQPSAQQPAQARPMARPVVAPMAQPVARTNTREEYQRRRQEYLERQKREMEARKAKVVATAVGENIQRGPSSAAEAEVIGADPAAVAAAPAPAAATQAKAATKGGKATVAAAAAPEAAPAPEAPPSKAALDGDFLDSLLDDPLGGKK